MIPKSLSLLHLPIYSRIDPMIKVEDKSTFFTLQDSTSYAWDVTTLGSFIRWWEKNGVLLAPCCVVMNFFHGVHADDRSHLFLATGEKKETQGDMSHEFQWSFRFLNLSLLPKELLSRILVLASYDSLVAGWVVLIRDEVIVTISLKARMLLKSAEMRRLLFCWSGRRQLGWIAASINDKHKPHARMLGNALSELHDFLP